MDMGGWLFGMTLSLTGAALVSCGGSATTPTIDSPVLDLMGDYLGQEPPGRTPRIFAPDIISGQRLHATPSFAPDGSEVYWAVSGNGPGQSRIWFSERVDNHWTEPRIAPFSQTGDGDNPVVAPDGRTLYFNSTRLLDGEERERIWFVRRETDGSWSAPSPASPVINGQALHWQTSSDLGGNFFFGSERAPNLGRDDIFLSEYVSGEFRDAVNLGSPINTEAHESQPYIDPDGRFLIFSRQEAQEEGELMVSRRVFGGSWEPPINLTQANNNLRGECPQITPDGRYLFLLRYDDGVFNVYWVDAEVLYEILEI